jgi:hypothetical protein
MITDEKIKEVRKMLRSGVPPGEVREDLVRQGYAEEDFKKVFTAHKYDMRNWYLTFAIIIFIVGLWLFFREETLMNYIILLFSIFLFFQYFREKERIKKNKTSN